MVIAADPGAASTGTLRAFQRHHHLLQGLGGRGSAAGAILVLAAMGMQIVSGRVEHGVEHHGRLADWQKFLVAFCVAARSRQWFPAAWLVTAGYPLKS